MSPALTMASLRLFPQLASSAAYVFSEPIQDWTLGTIPGGSLATDLYVYHSYNAAGQYVEYAVTYQQAVTPNVPPNPVPAGGPASNSAVTPCPMSQAPAGYQVVGLPTGLELEAIAPAPAPTPQQATDSANLAEILTTVQANQTLLDRIVAKLGA
jgi:hypothetical protein